MTDEDIKYIQNLLRQGTVKWSGRAECLKRARKKVLVGHGKKSRKPIYKYHWKCAKCRVWSRDEDSMEVDHIVEIGAYEGCLHKYAAKMYCGQENLQALCQSCHLKKTLAYSNARIRWNRKVKK